MLYFVEKHAGSDLSTKELSRETQDVVLCFSLLRFLDAFHQNRAQSTLLYCLIKKQFAVNNLYLFLLEQKTEGSCNYFE